MIKELWTVEISASLLRVVKDWKPADEYRHFPETMQKTVHQHKSPKKASERLSSTARLLMGHIRRLERKGALETTKASLGGWLNRCRRAVRYALAELEAAGLIRTETIKGPLGLYSGVMIYIQDAFDAAGFYEKAARLPESRGAIHCTTSTDSILLTLQRRALNKIRAEKTAYKRLSQYALQLE